MAERLGNSNVRTGVGLGQECLFSRGADPEVATAWSYGLLGAVHFVTLWWLREQKPAADTVVEQITALLWSGMGLD